MTEKFKRKNEDMPTPLWKTAWKYGIVFPIKGVWRYGVVLPTKGVWSATKWVMRWSWRATVWTAKAPFRFLGWLFGTNVPDYLSEREKAAYRRIKRYYRRRNRFIAHSFIYGMGWVMALAQILALVRQGSGSFIESVSGFMVIWTLLLAFHFIRVRMGEAEDNALAQVVENDAAAAYMPRKRGTLAYHETYEEEPVYDDAAYHHLTDDGEFVDDIPDYYEEERVYKGRR